MHLLRQSAFTSKLSSNFLHEIFTCTRFNADWYSAVLVRVRQKMKSVGNLLSGIRLGGLLGKVRKDQSGATAIEFAMVATPFLMLVFGIIQIGLLFFTTFTIEAGM